jgi:hypothetical protein
MPGVEQFGPPAPRVQITQSSVHSRQVASLWKAFGVETGPVRAAGSAAASTTVPSTTATIAASEAPSLGGVEEGSAIVLLLEPPPVSPAGGAAVNQVPEPRLRGAGLTTAAAPFLIS